jgi:acyl-CoA synthetase (AMP-forming)/AMP-acid ligase II
VIAAGGASLNIANGVREFARANPTAVAVIDEGRQATYAALDERSSRLATGLLAAGLRPGEPVAVLMGNRLEYFETAAGLAKAGLPMVPISPGSVVPEVAYILAHSGAQGLVIDGRLAGLLPGDHTGLRVMVCIGGAEAGVPYEDFVESSRPADPGVSVDERDPFCIAYTSGTTGRPKGVLLSHRSRTLTFYASALEWGLGLGRRSIAVAPMYHGAGFAFAFAPVFTGGTVTVLRRWDPERLLTLIEESRAQSVFLVPTHAQMIRSLGDDRLARADLSSLDTLFFNAAALPMALKEWVMAAFPAAGVHELYGSTEASVVTDLRPADARRKPGSVGHPWFMTEVRVVGADGQPVPPGTPGELFSRSPYLMNGYLRDKAATAACTTMDGFLTSGDVATVDDEGYLCIVDRVKDMIVTGGINVYPREIEEIVTAYPGVREVAVVGVPDEKWGETMTAYVVIDPGSPVHAAALDAHLRGRIAAFKRPRSWQFIDALPRNAAGKILKHKLRSLASTDRTGEL